MATRHEEAKGVRIQVRVTPEDPRTLGHLFGHFLVFASTGSSWISGLTGGALCRGLLDVPEAQTVRLVYQLRAALIVTTIPEHIVWVAIGWAVSALYDSSGQSIEAVVALSVAVQTTFIGVSPLPLLFLSAFWAWYILDRTLLVLTCRKARAFAEKALEQRRRLRRLRECAEYDSSDSETE